VPADPAQSIAADFFNTIDPKRTLTGAQFSGATLPPTRPSNTVRLAFSPVELIGDFQQSERLGKSAMPLIEFGKAGGRIPLALTGDDIDLIVLNGGQGFVRQSSSKRLIRDAERVAKILPAGRSFALLNYDAEPPLGLTVDDVVAQTAAAIEELAPGRTIDLVGISYGGMIACHLAAAHPERINHLVLVASGHRFSPRGTEHVRRQIALLEAGDEAGFASIFSGLFRNRVLNWLMDVMIRLGRKRVVGGMAPTPVILTYLNAMLSARPAELAAISAPTLVIGGSADQFFGDGIMEEAAAAVRHGTVHILPSETHTAPVEASSGFRDSIQAFLMKR
jgi:pimeloyl-ACP methyl ester carboxylesterase